MFHQRDFIPLDWIFPRFYSEFHAIQNATNWTLNALCVHRIFIFWIYLSPCMCTRVYMKFSRRNSESADIDVIIANGEYFVKIHFDLRLFRYTQANVYIALYKLINFVFFNVPRSSIKTDSSYSPPRQYGTTQYALHSLEFISCQIILPAVSNRTRWNYSSLI